MRKLAHLIPFILLFCFMAPVAGVRHIWQDEAETAERARSILAYGVPRIIDPEGRLSLNAGGREIEEGTLHRYTPWLQFYVGAAGLAVGRGLGLSDDTSIRLPFVFLHAASSSVLSYALASVCAWPVTATVGISTLFGLQTVRILNDRSARYHAILDFLLLICLLGIALRQKPTANWFIGGSLFLLPQAHTIGGAVLASTIVIVLFVDALFETGTFRIAVRRELKRSILPSTISIFCILLLCRPWLQEAWTSGSSGRVRFTLNSTLEISYSFYLFAGWLSYLVWSRNWRTAGILTIMTAWIFVAVATLEANPFNQPRYYLSIPILFLFWPLVTGWLPLLNRNKSVVISIFAMGVVMSDAQGIVPYYQGVRLIIGDYSFSSANQPLRLALARIPKGEPVLIDYVPQFVNWYARENPVALMPRPIQKTKLNALNPFFTQKRLEPQWHVALLKQKGLWPCFSEETCDYRRFKINEGTYELNVDADAVNPAEAIRFCVVSQWSVDRWNNAPFSQYNPEARRPEGGPNDTLILARKCSK